MNQINLPSICSGSVVLRAKQCGPNRELDTVTQELPVGKCQSTVVNVSVLVCPVVAGVLTVTRNVQSAVLEPEPGRKTYISGMMQIFRFSNYTQVSSSAVACFSSGML